MRVRSILFVLLFLTLGIGVAGWGWGWRERGLLQDTDFTRRRLGFLEAENRRLGDLLDAKQRAEDAVTTAAQRSDIQRSVADLRQLPFLQPVNFREIPRSDLPEILRQKLAQQVPDREMGDTEVALSAMGLLPRGLDLKKTYLALLGEQVGAFYDQHSKELFTFSGQSLNNAQNRVILAHELTHALEDQHFNLLRLPLEAKGNDDRALAASALVEGDATLVMNRYMTDNLSAAVLKDSLAGALSTDVRQLAAAPRYLRESLLFPYLRGLEFCQALYAREGWDALARAFEHPPASTAEILHPARYLAQPRQDPVAITFSRTVVLGQNPLVDNVLGEFGVRQLLALGLKDDPAAAQAAEGWRGDRYLVYGDAKASSYVWQTCWNDQSGAERFSAALLRCLAVRYKNLAFMPASGQNGMVTSSSPAPGDSRRGVALIRISPKAVVLIDAQDEHWFSAMQALYTVQQAGL